MEILQAQVFFRHGRRTPNRDFPMYQELDKWTGVADGKMEVGGGIIAVRLCHPDTALALSAGEQESLGNFKMGGGPTVLDAATGFEIGDLTTNGMQDAFDLGKRLSDRYIEAGLFMEGELASDRAMMDVVSTPVRRTIDTASGVLTALLGTNEGAVDIILAGMTPRANWLHCALLPQRPAPPPQPFSHTP
jgi:hypothetical protein